VHGRGIREKKKRKNKEGPGDQMGIERTFVNYLHHPQRYKKKRKKKKANYQMRTMYDQSFAEGGKGSVIARRGRKKRHRITAQQGRECHPSMLKGAEVRGQRLKPKKKEEQTPHLTPGCISVCHGGERIRRWGGGKT